MLRHLFTSTIILSGAAVMATSASAQNYDAYTQQAQNYAGAATETGLDAHSACKSGESKRKLIGGALGGAAGSYAGAKLGGDDETKGAVIGGLVGGVAGYGLADKTIDCDPVYEDRYGQPYADTQTYNGAGHAGSTYSHGSTYSRPAPSYAHTASSGGYAQPAHYTQPASYAAQTASVGQNVYTERTYVSTHPAYSDPSYGADMRRIYVDRQAPRLTQAGTIYAPAQSETVRYAVPATYQAAAPAPSYSQTQPTIYRASTPSSSSRVPVRHMMSGRRHMHGKYACTQAH